MKLRQLNYILWILLFIFGIFYFAGTLTKDSFLNTFTDLWANLFASLVVLVVIEQIVKQSRKEELEPSKRNIGNRITIVLEALIQHSTPPKDWKKMFEIKSICLNIQIDFCRIEPALWKN